MADFLDGYERVMAAVRAQHKARTGSERGAAVWLAKKLGCTRQSIDNYGKRHGFPQRYAAKLAKITGLSEREICPIGRMIVYFAAEDQERIIRVSREIRRSLPETVVELVRIGLNSRGKS